MEERYRDTVQDDEDFDEEDEEMDYEGQDALLDKAKLPSVNDPRLWQVRVKRGGER